MSILPEEYTVIITSDHGGHGVTHGSDSPEDMIIPIFLIGDSFAAGKEIAGASILDVAPTVVHLFGVAPQKAWEGTVLK